MAAPIPPPGAKRPRSELVDELVEAAERPRDALTDRLIREALEDEQARKREKKGLPPVGTGPVTTSKVHKGKTLAEIEDEEGGPVKESLVGMAHVKRAQRRRAGAGAAETDVPDDIAAAEEGAEEEEEDDDEDEDEGDEGDGGREGGGARGAKGAGAKKAARGAAAKAPKKGGGPTAAEVAPLPGDDAAPLTAFNLNEERAEGHFDEDGNFVFDKAGAEDREDEWLRSDEGRAVASAELRAKVEAEHAAMKAAEAAPVLSEAQVARAQLEMSRLLKPGETVAAGLKRMRGGDAGPKKAMGKREKARLAKLEAERAAKAASKGGAAGAAGPSGPDDAGFQRLAELADMLVSAGELDVYTSTCEQLRRWAALTLPKSEVEGDAGGGGAGGGKPAAEADADEDMFASDDEAGGGGGGGGAGSKPAAAAQAAAPAAAPAAAAPAGAPAAAPGGGSGDGPAQGQGAEAAAAPAAAAAAPSGGDDYASWPIKELRRFLQERGQDSAGIVEKGDLVARVREVAAQGPLRTR